MNIPGTATCISPVIPLPVLASVAPDRQDRFFKIDQTRCMRETVACTDEIGAEGSMKTEEWIT
jgi:hypothetical protein